MAGAFAQSLLELESTTSHFALSISSDEDELEKPPVAKKPRRTEPVLEKGAKAADNGAVATVARTGVTSTGARGAKDKDKARTGPDQLQGDVGVEDGLAVDGGRRLRRPEREVPLPRPPPRPTEPAPEVPAPRPKSTKSLGAIPLPPPRPALPTPAVERPVKRAKTHADVTRHLSPTSSSSSVEILTTTTTSNTRPSKRKEKAAPSRVAKLQKSVTAPQPIPAAGPVPKGRGKNKPRPSLEVVIGKTDKLSGPDLAKQFPTISSYVSHLSEHEFASPPSRPGIFTGCRVIVVNGYNKPNEIEVGARRNIGILLKNGATVVKPEDFAAPPRGWKPPEDETDEATRERSEKEGWTTHIIPLTIEGAAQPKFESVFRLLGPGPNELAEEDLGHFVKVVSFKWVSESINQRARVPEPFYSLQRTAVLEPAAAPRTEVKENAPALGGAGRKRKKATPDTDDEEERLKVGAGDKDTRSRGISPFGPDDYPTGEPIPPGYFGSPSERSHVDGPANENETTDAIVDPPLTTTPAPKGRAFSGLEDQFKVLEDFEGIEELLDHFDNCAKDSKDFVYSERPDDNQTDEEDADSEGEKPLRVKKPPGTRYACDVSSTGGVKEPSPNEHIAKVLDQLAKMATDKKGWRERGYKRAAGAFRNCPRPITNYVDAKKLPGVGESIAKKIAEIAKTGTHRRTMQKSEKGDAIKIFMGIYGVGPKIAEDFYDRGCRTLDDVFKKEHLTESQALGLKYYDDLAKRIPPNEVEKLYQFANDAAKEIDPKLQVECMGSFRRGQPDCGDIDLLITRDPSKDGKDHTGLIKKVFDKLKLMGIIRHSLTNPEDWNALDVKFNGLCALPDGLMRRIDILGVPWDEMPAALILFTGNDYFNRSMRLKARHLGYRLNQRGLFKDVSRGRDGLKLTDGKRVECKTEQDIFALLGVTWKPPNERMP